MNFNNGDFLKQLKKDMINPLYRSGNYMPNAGILESLLSRLEAAEKVCRAMNLQDNHSQVCHDCTFCMECSEICEPCEGCLQEREDLKNIWQVFDSWRKAAGKL